MTDKYDLTKRMHRKEVVTQCVGYVTIDNKVERCGLLESNGSWLEHPLAHIYPYKTHGLCPECYEKAMEVIKDD